MAEHSPNICYLEGKLNVLAGTFSHLPQFDDCLAIEGKGKSSEATPELLDACHAAQELALLECLKNFPESDDCHEVQDHLLNLLVAEDCPLDLMWPRGTQEGNERLMGLSTCFFRKFNNDVQLVCCAKDGKDMESDWKIASANKALDPLISWFHQTLNHPGLDQTSEGMSHCCHPEMKNKFGAFKWDACQRHKFDGKDMGYFPPCEVWAAPWEQVDTHLAGPWMVEARTGKAHEFSALTLMHRVMGLAELIRPDNKTAMHVVAKFKESWLSRHPHLILCSCDNVGEFKADCLQFLMHFTIKNVPTTNHNPAANGICEHMHQTVGSVMKTLANQNKLCTLEHAQTETDQPLAVALHTMQTNVNQATSCSPGVMVF